MLQPDVYARINAVFDRYGVPASVWYPIMMMESSGNPQAVGDSGVSIGLFQLNTAAGQGYGWNKEYLFDPVNNAEVAAPSIAAAYQAIKGVVPREKWASETAIRSGHPGGSVNKPLTSSAGDKARARLDALQTKYDTGAQSVTTGTELLQSVPGVSYFAGKIQKDTAENMPAWVARLLDPNMWVSVSLAGIGGVLLLVVLIVAVASSDEGKKAIDVAKIAAVVA